MHDLNLRPATEDDSEFAFQVKKAAFRKYVDNVWGWDENEQRRLHERRFDAQDVSIICVDGEAVGYLSSSTETDHLHLNQIFILPEYQGKGIGAECTRLMLDEARRLGLPARLRVLKVNPRARALYERFGFVRMGETETHDLMEWTP